MKDASVNHWFPSGLWKRLKNNGEGGIRTHGNARRYTGFRDQYGQSGEGVETTVVAPDSEGAPAPVLASCLAFWDRECPDWAAVARAWPVLPPVIRAGIMAMIQATGNAGTAPRPQPPSTPHHPTPEQGGRP